MDTLENHRILLLQSDDSIRRIVSYHLERAGYEVEFAENSAQALTQKKKVPACVVIDPMTPGSGGMAVMKQFCEQFHEVPVVAMVSHGGASDGLAAVRLGAFDYVTKPLDVGAFVSTIAAAVRTGQSLRQPISPLLGLRDTQWVGQSASARTLRETATTLGATQADVLVTGPVGCGKRLFARMLHHVSGRSRAPLVALQCAGVSGELLEAELFGMTGRVSTAGGEEASRNGRVQMADGGTLLLLNVGEAPLAQQLLILDLLQNRWIHRRETGEFIPVNVRVIATSRIDLRTKVEAKQFREDLLYRLNALTVEIPSLRERIEDVPLLSAVFLQRLARAQSLKVPRMSSAVNGLLNRYWWPGNVRELESVLNWAYSHAAGDEIRVADLPQNLVESGKPTVAVSNQGDLSVPHFGGIPLKTVEKLALQQTLALCQGNKAAAARILNVTEKTIYNMLCRFGLNNRAPSVPVSERKRTGKSKTKVNRAGT